MRPRFSAAFVMLVLALSACDFVRAAQAGIPVVDSGNITQSTITATNNVKQTLGQAQTIAKQAQQYSKQIQQYQKQLQQYQKQIQQYDLDMLNTRAPDSFVWKEAESVIDELIDSIDTLGYYENSLGSINAYLGQFQDVAHYKSSPCFSEDGCSESEVSAIVRNEELSSESQKKANDALLKGLAKQQEDLKADAQKLELLQRASQTATGRLAVLQYANQFASLQASQMMQIRGLLMAQQNAMASEMQAQSNRTAQERASSTRLRKGGFKKSPSRSW